MDYELVSCKLRHGDRAQLLHHAEFIKDAPTLGNLSIHKSVYRDSGNSGRLAGRRESCQFALMRALGGPAGHDLIPFGDLVIDREMNIREGVAVGCDELFAALGAIRKARNGSWATVDVVLDEYLIQHSQIPFIPDFIEETA